MSCGREIAREDDNIAIKEGVWDCPYCGATRIRGPETECNNCGASRDDDVKLYLPEGAAEVTDEQALKRASAGADWRCGFCGSESPAGTEVCTECGAKPDGTERRRADPPPAPPTPAAAVQKVQKKSGGGRWWIALLVLGAIAAVLYFFVFRTHAEQVEVKAHEWERVIQIEKFKTITEEDWEDKVPSDARVLSRRKALFKTEKIKVGTKRVKTGVKDLGNGYFEDVYEDRPIYKDQKIYKDKVRYHVDRWRPARKAKASARDTKPHWPKFKLREKERRGKRTETYRLLLRTAEGEDVEFEVDDQKRWTWYEDGNSYEAQIRVSGGIAELQLPAEEP